jgi:hypothetical protein
MLSSTSRTSDTCFIFRYLLFSSGARFRKSETAARPR